MITILNRNDRNWDQAKLAASDIVSIYRFNLLKVKHYLALAWASFLDRIIYIESLIY